MRRLPAVLYVLAQGSVFLGGVAAVEFGSPWPVVVGFAVGLPLALVALRREQRLGEEERRVE